MTQGLNFSRKKESTQKKIAFDITLSESSKEEESKYGEELLKSRYRSVEAKNAQFNGPVNKQFNYFGGNEKVRYLNYKLVEKYPDISISGEEIKHYANKLLKSRILILKSPDGELISTILAKLGPFKGINGCSWKSINFTDTVKKSGQSLIQETKQSKLAEHGLEIFHMQALASEKNRVWLIDVGKSAFLQNVVGSSNLNVLESTVDHLTTLESYTIWLVSDKESCKELNDLSKLFPSSFENDFPIWEIDFLPSFIEHHFTGLEDGDIKGNELLKDIKAQIELWAPDGTSHQLYERLRREIRKGKSAFLEEVRNYVDQLNGYDKNLHKGILKIQDEKRNNAISLVKSANLAERIILFIASVLDPLPLNDFQYLANFLLAEIEVINLSREYSNNENNNSDSILKSILELDIDISVKDLNKILSSQGVSPVKTKDENYSESDNIISGEEYYRKNSRNIFERFRLESYYDKEGKQLIGFTDAVYEEQIEVYFHTKDPDFFQTQFEKIVKLSEAALINPNIISDELSDSIILLMCRVARTNPYFYGSRLLIPMFEKAIRLAPFTREQRLELMKTKESELGIEFYDKLVDEEQLINKIVRWRLVFFFEQFFKSGSKELEEVVFNILDITISLTQKVEDVSNLALDLIWQTRYLEEVDTLDFLEKLFDRWNVNNSQEGLEFLVELAKQSGKEIPNFFEKIKRWMPEEDDYTDFKNENAKRVSVLFFFYFADRLFADNGVRNSFGEWPNTYFLFKVLPENEKDRDSLLKCFIEMLFDKRVEHALGYWIDHTHNYEYWDSKVRDGEEFGRNRVEKIHYTFALLRNEPDPDGITLSSELKNYLISKALVEEINRKQLDIFINWVAVLSYNRTADEDYKGNIISIKLIRFLFNRLDKQERRRMKEYLKQVSWSILKQSNQVSSKEDKLTLKINRRLFKFILKHFRE